MTTNRFITIVVIVTIAILALLGWWYVSSVSTTSTGSTSGIEKTLHSFFPFGGSATTTANSQTNTTTSTTTQNSIDETSDGSATAIPRLRQVTSEPVAGASIFSVTTPKTIRAATSTASTTASSYIVYVEQGTGHIYKEFVDSPTQLISATTIPKVDAAFVGTNNAVAYQYFKNDNETLETFLGQIVNPIIATSSSADDSPASGKVSGSFLPQDIYRFDMAPSGDRIFYLAQGPTGDVGYVANIDGSKPTQVVSSPLREWDISWPSTNNVLMTTSPDSSVSGYLYSLNLATKNFSQILGGISGLTAIANPDLSYYIYSEATYNGFTTHVYRPKDDFDASIPLVTLPEKCTWSSTNTSIAYCAVPTSIPSAGYPESWYRGDVSFNDNIWKLDLKAGTSTEILNFSQQSNGGSADMINLSVDQGDHYLIFKNKKDTTLWQYRLDDTVNGL